MIPKLKQELLKTHQEDKRLTAISISLQIVVLIIGALLLYILAKDRIVIMINSITNEKGESFRYFQGLLLVIIIIYLAYLISIYIQVTRRTSKIDTFFDKISDGAIAQHLMEHRIYKITIPILKLKLKFFPIEYITIFLTNDPNTKGYKFPIAPEIIPEFKKLVSGLENDELHNAWYELYDNTLTVSSTDVIELPSEKAFNTFIKEQLASEIPSIAQSQLRQRKSYIMYIVVALIILTGWYSFMYSVNISNILKQYKSFFIGAFIGFFIILYGVIAIKRGSTTDVNSNHLYKTNIFKAIINFIAPGFQYVLHGHISLEEFINIGLFQSKNYRITGNDQIIGNYKNVAFQRCDLLVEKVPDISTKTQIPNKVFSGQLFMAKFNKAFKCELYLIPKIGILNFDNDAETYLSHDLDETVTLEDPEFMKMYTVYSNDQIEARYILSTALMQRLKDLTLATKGKYFISFKDQRITIANNNGKDSFETNVFTNYTDELLIPLFYKEFCDQLSVIDQLNLNINIWKS
ncbi:DUF3137 domain-containing protein [Aquimarina megaterium]|uniref:DUF3137 domain-containing protein n=1 Tax=Aquimarina megaterium TaxID=1443666 RepID=UPI0009427D76|nr:DUF3137 domain-containing protein [Aquimarina megaterium]